MPINYGVLQPPAQPQVQVMSAPTTSGGDDIMGGLKGLLGGLKGITSAFGPNPVSQANSAISQSMASAAPQQITQSLIPSVIQQNNPQNVLSAAQNQLKQQVTQTPHFSAPSPVAQGQNSSILNNTMQSIADIESGSAKNPYGLISKPGRSNIIGIFILI